MTWWNTVRTVAAVRAWVEKGAWLGLSWGSACAVGGVAEIVEENSRFHCVVPTSDAVLKKVDSGKSLCAGTPFDCGLELEDTQAEERRCRNDEK